MPLLKGALTATRFKVVGAFPDDWVEAMEPHWFRPSLSPTVKRTVGWCVVDAPEEGGAEAINRWSLPNYILLGYRIDEKKINKPMFKALLQVRIKAWCKANARERVPASVKQGLSETLEMEMLQQTLPSLKVIEVAISLNDRWALIGSMAEGTLEEIRKAVFKVTGLRLLQDGHLGSADSIGGESEVDKTVAVARHFWDPKATTWAAPALRVGRPEEEDAPIRFEHLSAGAGFLGWLWSVGLEGGEAQMADGGQITVALQEEVRLATLLATHDEVVLRLDEPSASEEARTALNAGRFPTKVGVFVRREDREYTFTLSASPLGLAAIRLPTQVRTGSIEEVWLGRAFCYEEIVWIVESLLREYIAISHDPVRGPKWVRAWSAWMENSEGFEEA